tara:strand:- start:1311 stop:3017 length:1707 start_codon:yes stop_codon:yes gene_type:complete
MSKSPIYIGAGSSSLASSSALNIIDNSADIAKERATATYWAKKTDGSVVDQVTGADSSEYSSKAYAVGGTGVTDTAGKGAAKEWALETTGTVDGTSFSAKEYAQGTQASTGGSAKDYAQKTDGGVSGATSDHSAKAWAIGGTGVTDTASKGAAKEWAIETSGNVDGTSFSAKEYAQGTQASTGGSAKDYAQKVDGGVSGATSDHSAKAWAVGGTGVTDTASKGAAKEWAIKAEDSTVDGTNYSALHWSTKASTTYDNFDDRFLGAHTTAEREVGASNIGKDHDGDALVTGALYYDTTLSVMKVWNGSAWARITPTTSDQANIDAVTANATNINTVAGINANVTTVAGISSDVTAVAGDATDIGTVAGKATEIGLLGTSDMATAGTGHLARLGTADVVADMALLGTADCVSDMNSLATPSKLTQMSHLGNAQVTEDMGYLGTADCVADMALLGTTDCVADMALLGTTDCVADMALLATTDVIADLDTVATNITDVNTFADRYQIDDFSPSAPTTDGGGNALAEGDLAYDSTANKMKFYNGSAWEGFGLSQTEVQTEANNASVAMAIALG